jgi:hypothetical protein
LVIRPLRNGRIANPSYQAGAPPDLEPWLGWLGPLREQFPPPSPLDHDFAAKWRELGIDPNEWRAS